MLKPVTPAPICRSARDLGVNEGTLGNWVNQARAAREGTEGLSTGDIDELKRLRAENAELDCPERQPPVTSVLPHLPQVMIPASRLFALLWRRWQFDYPAASQAAQTIRTGPADSV